LTHSGAVNNIKIGSIADYTPNAGVTVYDRDRVGQVIGCHNSSGIGLSNLGRYGWLGISEGCNPPTSPSYPQNRTSSFASVGRGAILFASKSDGLSDGSTTIQGVRTFDPVIGMWNSPDVYRGTVHDPASQKPYMWNGNNPYLYSDPSGYDAETDSLRGGPPGKGLERRFVGILRYIADERMSVEKQLGSLKGAPEFNEDNAARHIFNNRPGHIMDSALNRYVLRQITVVGKKVEVTNLKQGGSLETYAKEGGHGGEWWVEVRTFIDANGRIVREVTNGGFNPIPRYIKPRQ